MSKSKLPDLLKGYRSMRRFRQEKRQEAKEVQEKLYWLAAHSEHTPAASDIRDMQILLDRIQLDLSQKRWGK